MSRICLSLTAIVAAGGLLAGCAQHASTAYQPGLGSPGVGTVAGAAGGAALGRWAAGGNNNLAGILGGAALGAIAGNVLLDGPKDAEGRTQAQIDADLANQRQLDYERQRQLQQVEVERQIRERQEFEEWQRTRGSTTATAPVDAHGDVLTAQRYLMALGYYNGRVDGIIGPETRRAVTRFQSDRGLSPTGAVTHSLLQQMRSSLG